ncbi:MAG: hypothetical protein ACOVSW_13315 [Candidatus Kapaibacteriota bacterium]|jgi:hypothetical protein
MTSRDIRQSFLSEFLCATNMQRCISAWLMLSMMVLLTISLQAQSVEMSVMSGFGKPYVIESIEEYKELNIGFAPIFGATLKYTPDSSDSWGVMLSVQHFEVRAKGLTKITQTSVDGFIGNTSFFAVAESNKPFESTEKYSFISGYGLGLSNENYVFAAEKQPRTNLYASILAYFGFGYRLNDRVQIRITDSFIVTDFIKGISYLTGNWTGQSAGEDVSNFLMISLSYKF